MKHRNPVTKREKTHTKFSLPDPDTTGVMARVKNRPGTFEKGNSMGRGRSPKMNLLGMSVRAEDPLYREAVTAAKGYRKRRMKEFYITFGYVSSGVGGFITNGALAMATGRYLYSKAMQCNEPNVHILKLASQMFVDFRQNEMAAYELATREAKAAKAALETSTVIAPWLEDAAQSKASAIRSINRSGALNQVDPETFFQAAELKGVRAAEKADAMAATGVYADMEDFYERMAKEGSDEVVGGSAGPSEGAGEPDDGGGQGPEGR